MSDINPSAILTVRAHVEATQTIAHQLPQTISQEMQIWEAEVLHPKRATSADLLAKLFSLENAIQMMMTNPGYYEIHALNNAIANLPEQLRNTDDIQKLKEAHQLLFTAKNGKNLAARWFNAAVTPGASNLLLAQATSDWTTIIHRLGNEPELERNHLSASDVSHNPHLPAREDIKQGSKKSKGWSKVSYSAEDGYQVVYQTMLVTQVGTAISRSRTYPTIADLE